MKYTLSQSKQFARLEREANKLLNKSKGTNNYLLRKKLGKRNNRYVQQLRNKATPEEVVVGRWLLTQDIYFIFQKGFFKPFHRIVDFYLPRRGILEIDGGYHNNTEEKDSRKDYLWNRDRYMPTIRITNEQVWDGTFILLLKEFIGSKRLPRDKTHKPRCPKDWFLVKPTF
jgi:very-short-patch-repair endonuclease